MLIASVQQSVESFRAIAEQEVPYILFDRYFPDLEANFIGVDDKAVGMLATSHLIEQGCKRIAHLRGPGISTAVGRFEGYKAALKSRKLALCPEYVIAMGTSADHRGELRGYEATRKLLANRLRPDGIFCFNDPCALGAMRAIFDAGLRIPEDVAIVGCGNISYDDLLRVPLSSVDQNSEALGKKAAALALSLARNKGTPRTKKELIQPHLEVRASSLREPLSRKSRT